MLVAKLVPHALLLAMLVAKVLAMGHAVD